ncbi:MAG: phosphatidylserine/phosphatidylglycerophosphate/cardiolipin synthase family protein [Bacteriovoracaceae bacterium]|nr:phosphatidylserine/phosphatidylglycerophosphate/cardiolipin synthase family protein [Bacteriovoracaceae bacterium]
MEKVVTSATLYFESLLQDIQKAQKSIFLECYIFEWDEVGEKIGKALAKKAQEGLDVRLLVDAIGSLSFDKKNYEELLKQKVRVHIYHPLPWKIWQWTKKKSAIVHGDSFLKLWRHLNKRLHRKSLIIDSKIAWVGSYNITQTHLKQWKDVAISFQDERVAFLQEAFYKAWGEPFSLRFFQIPSDLYLNIFFWQRMRGRRIFFQKIKKAQKRIWLLSAYFIPERRFLRRLKQAGRLGQDVRLFLPQNSDVFFMHWSARIFYAELLNSGVRIFEYQGGVLHAKVSLIDEEGMVGSSNLNHRSFNHDLEVDIVLREEQSKLDLQAFYDEIQKGSQEIKKEDMQKLPLFKMIFGRFFLLFKFWL